MDCLHTAFGARLADQRLLTEDRNQPSGIVFSGGNLEPAKLEGHLR